MTQLAQRILDQALTLSLDERAQIVGELLTSLDGPTEAGVEEAWTHEIGRRLKAIDAGEVEPVSWEDAEAMIFGDEHGRSSTAGV
jgi:putative addiction module component (TIGR02574 family)